VALPTLARKIRGNRRAQILTSEHWVPMLTRVKEAQGGDGQESPGSMPSPGVELTNPQPQELSFLEMCGHNS
jgi:hypothetical protein